MTLQRVRTWFSRRSVGSLVAVVGAASVAGAVAFAVACGPSGFQSSTVVDSVRILATRADNDKSYALPGDVVTVETLTVDGRATQTPPAVTYWIPFVCENPFDDLYYGCFASLFGADGGAGDASLGTEGGDAGVGDADGGTAPLSPTIPPDDLAKLFKPGVDLTPLLPTGSYTFKVPTDIIAGHAPVAGTTPYGLVILFNIACAGRVMTTAIDPAGGPEQVPIGCFDDNGNALDPDQYVIGYSRVYVSTDPAKVNANPRINGFLLNDVEISTQGADGGIPSPITLPAMKACHQTCAAVALDIDVPASSWSPGKKSIWVDYYARGGNLGDEARLLYDVNAGRTSDTGHEVMYQPPDNPGLATIWAVVHDSNDGVTWLQLNVVAE
jgi:hypothetical protein